VFTNVRTLRVPVVYLTSYYFRFNTVTTSHPLIHPPPPAPQFITKYDNDTNQHLSKLKSAGLPSFQKKEEDNLPIFTRPLNIYRIPVLCPYARTIQVPNNNEHNEPTQPIPAVYMLVKHRITFLIAYHPIQTQAHTPKRSVDPSHVVQACSLPPFRGTSRYGTIVARRRGGGTRKNFSLIPQLRTVSKG